IFGFLPVVLRPVAAPAVQWILYGALMIVIVFMLPRGIVPALQRAMVNWTTPARKPALAPSIDAAKPGEGQMPGRAASGEVTLSVAHVAVHFGGLVALSDLDFKVFQGEIVALIGPNGAGKTTAFNVFTGFLKAAAGEVRYRNTLLNGLKPHHIAALGLVRTFQRTSIFERNTVFEIVLTGLPRRGRSSLWDTLLALPRERVAEAELADEARNILSVVGLERRAADMAGTLPYGEQRLLGMALALAA